MSTTLTIRNLDATVKQKLRVQAARHGRAMEAEAREILTQAVMQQTLDGSVSSTSTPASRSPCADVRGRWKGRMSTDSILALTRGE